ncbi:MAG TPA: hypothetical protein VFU21_06610, partial [Kofleriaceae bacterium]|nr:hypothetical protein [Kofleriaceae bacterium]
QSACVAGIVPPSRTEVGTTVIAGEGQPQSGVRFATGAHLASGQTSRERRFDVGAGMVYERLAAPPLGSQERPLAAAPTPPSAGQPPEVLDAYGTYVDAAAVVQRGRWHRTWLGARSELLRQEGPTGPHAVSATFARVAWETYAPAHAAGGFSSSNAFGAGFAYGSFALGLFLESGIRTTDGERPAFVAIGGMSLRMPWLGGFAIDLTPKW